MFRQPTLCLNTAEHRNLRRFADLTVALCPSPRVLIVGRGSDELPELSGQLLNLDLSPGPEVHLCGDVVRLPFQSGTFDGVVAKAVLEHVVNPWGAVQELHRILRPGGYCYVEVPFLQPFHPAPGDHQRFTQSGLAHLMSGFHQMDLGLCVGPTAALLWTLQVYLSLLLSFNQTRLFNGWLLVFGYVLSPLKYLDRLAVRWRHADRIASGFYYLGQKL